MRGRDTATAILNRSIDYKNMIGNEKYYINFYSVNKLMYFVYCEYLKQKRKFFNYGIRKNNSRFIRAFI